MRRNETTGIIIQGDASFSTPLTASVSDTAIAENAIGVDIDCLMSDGTVAISESVVSNNAGTGIQAAGAGCAVSVSHNVIAGNGGNSMLNASAGSFVSFGDNRVHGNHPDAPSGTITPVASR